MARRYEIDELLLLRDSPLAVKPDSLPPAEEWMGYVPAVFPVICYYAVVRVQYVR